MVRKTGVKDKVNPLRYFYLSGSKQMNECPGNLAFMFENNVSSSRPQVAVDNNASHFGRKLGLKTIELPGAKFSKY